MKKGKTGNGKILNIKDPETMAESEMERGYPLPAHKRPRVGVAGKAAFKRAAEEAIERYIDIIKEFEEYSISVIQLGDSDKTDFT
jgi:hypothetical protein